MKSNIRVKATVSQSVPIVVGYKTQTLTPFKLTNKATNPAASKMALGASIKGPMGKGYLTDKTGGATTNGVQRSS